ncbi:MAG: methyl-accepting chemotaxis protein, partial [Methylotenera sp.]|nr:methyl-accepting chemotaxis protein [Methylotenera sp.]
EVTQQNAALVEQAAAAAESLVDQAVGLMDTVSAFKLSGGAAYASSGNQRALAKPAGASTKLKPAVRANARPAASLAKAPTEDGDWEEF